MSINGTAQAHLFSWKQELASAAVLVGVNAGAAYLTGGTSLIIPALGNAAYKYVSGRFFYWGISRVVNKCTKADLPGASKATVVFSKVTSIGLSLAAGNCIAFPATNATPYLPAYQGFGSSLTNSTVELSQEVILPLQNAVEVDAISDAVALTSVGLYLGCKKTTPSYLDQRLLDSVPYVPSSGRQSPEELVLEDADN